MAIGGAVFAAGRYTLTWNSLALGLMEGEGEGGCPTLIPTIHGEPIANSDGYAKSKIGVIAQGADWAAAFTCIEWSSAVLAALWPFGTFGLMGVPGREHTDMAQTLLLTAVAGTVAVTSGAGPLTITCPKALIAENTNPRFLLGPTLRKVPIRMNLFPTLINAFVGWFSTT